MSIKLPAGILVVGLLLGGCEPETHPTHPAPINYGTDGNRGVTAPSRGIPQNPEEKLGGEVMTAPGQTRPEQTIVGPAASADRSSGTATIGTGVVAPTANPPSTQPSGGPVNAGSDPRSR